MLYAANVGGCKTLNYMSEQENLLTHSVNYVLSAIITNQRRRFNEIVHLCK